MALRELPFQLGRLSLRDARPAITSSSRNSRRNASSKAVQSPSEHLQDLEPLSSLAAPGPSEGAQESFDPVAQSQVRKRQLPKSRYQYRSPRYYRGPLHPHQPPRPSDPASREFTPGPFTLTRLEQTYQNVIAPDLMTLTYSHLPYGYQAPPKAPRLREWDGSSPYHKNRPARGPRGGEVLRLLDRPTTFRTVPKLEKVVVHTMASDAMDNSAYLHSAGMALQAITGVRVTSFKTKKNVQQWNLRKGKYVSVKAELTGEDMYHFLEKCIDVVMPRIKDWKGVKGSSGDSSGNIAFGLSQEDVALFPEVEVNYDMYPPKMIPGCHVIVCTSATNDRDARLLLSSIGMPFYGKLVN